MTPHMIHFVAQEIRHEKAHLTSLEKLIKSYPQSPACRDFLQYIAVKRGLAESLLKQLEGFEITIEETAETVR